MTVMTPGKSEHSAAAKQIGECIRAGQRFLITSHARPDGDSIGSQVAMAFALRDLGKDARLVNCDPAPPHFQMFPGVADIEISSRIDDAWADALFVMECGDLSRTGIEGLNRFSIINIDHHPGNSAYGAINWFDESAAACGEMVFEVISALGVPLSVEIATHLYLAILTDTGSFHHSKITARTFDICRQAVQAGIDPAQMARDVYDSSSLGKVRLIGALLNNMQCLGGGRLAVLELDDALLRATGCDQQDTEGLSNLPLTAREIQAVVFFRIVGDEVRVSLRSKGDIDVRQIATAWGGGGHRNAAGFTLPGPIATARRAVIDRVTGVIAEHT